VYRSHDAVNICVCCLFVLTFEHFVHSLLDLAALGDALAAFVKVGIAPLADVVALLTPSPRDHWFRHEVCNKVLWASQNATRGTAGVGLSPLFVGLYDWLNLPLETDQRSGQILDLFARVVNFPTQVALIHNAIVHLNVW